MREVSEAAARLLSAGEVGVVVGWEDGPRGVRPAFVTSAGEAGRLVFDARCVHNLAVYLKPRRAELKRLGKAAVVVKACDAAAVAALVREGQLARSDVFLIGVRCRGVFSRPDERGELSSATLAPRCVDCERGDPQICDLLVGTAAARPAGGTGLAARVAEIEAMDPASRWAHWSAELERCVRCYACRQVCPLCFCEQCVANKSSPQWIETSPHARGNLAWHVIRALHQAGRCVGCGECERACPSGIPLSLINRKLQQVVAERYGFAVSDDPAVPAPIGVYRLDDPQEFIL